MLRTTHDVIAVPSCVCVDGRDKVFRLNTSQHCCEQGKIKALQSISLHLCADCQKKVGWRRLSSFRRYAGNDKVNSTHFRPSASAWDLHKINSSHDQSARPQMKTHFVGSFCGSSRSGMFAEKSPRLSAESFYSALLIHRLALHAWEALSDRKSKETASESRSNCEILSQ